MSLNYMKILFKSFFLLFFFISFAKSEEIKEIGTFKDWQAIMIINDSGKVCFAQSKPVLQSPKKVDREARLSVTS